MEVEAGADESRGGVGEESGFGVRRGARSGGVAAEGVERWFHSETAFSAAAFCGGFFGGGEGEGADLGN